MPQVPAVPGPAGLTEAVQHAFSDGGALSRVVLQAVPNFDAYNFGEWLLTDTAVSGRDLGNAFLSFLPRAAILLIAGLLLISFRDFAT